MQRQIGVALLGCGGVARRYRKTYAHLDGARVVVAIDIDAAEAQRAAAETGGRASSDLSDAFADDIDAVIITTPNHLHRHHAIAALGAGKHVLLQKPMARTTAECDDILAAAKASGKTLGIYMNLLDHPLFHDLRRMAHSGYLGKIGLVSARLAHRGGLGWKGGEANWRSSLEKTGGGSFVQLAVHYEHMVRWLLCDRFVRVQAIVKNLACPHLEGDDLALAHLELAGGALADLQTSWCVEEEHFSILGTRGSIHYRDNRWLEFTGEGGPFCGHVLRLDGAGKREVIDPLLAPEWDDARNPFNQHRRFIEALRHGADPDVTAEDGRDGVRAVEACYQSAREERVIYL